LDQKLRTRFQEGVKKEERRRQAGCHGCMIRSTASWKRTHYLIRSTWTWGFNVGGGEEGTYFVADKLDEGLFSNKKCKVIQPSVYWPVWRIINTATLTGTSITIFRETYDSRVLTGVCTESSSLLTPSSVSV
jgi:hypothetical protein